MCGRRNGHGQSTGGHQYQHQLDEPDDKTRARQAERTAAIKRHLKRGAVELVEVGRILQAEKDDAGHGGYLKWLRRDFPSWSESTSLRYRRFYKAVEVDKTITLTDLAKVGLTVATYLLAPSTPAAVREEAVARANRGEHLSVPSVRQIKNERTPPPMVDVTVESRRRRSCPRRSFGFKPISRLW